MNDTPEGDRSISAVSSRRPWLTRGQSVTFGLIVVAAIIALIFLAAPSNKPKEEEDTHRPTQHKVAVADYVPPPPVTLASTSQPPLPKPSDFSHAVDKTVTKSDKPDRPAMASYSLPPVLESARPKIETEKAAASARSEGSGGTKVVYKPAVITGGKAGTIADSNLMLRPGLLQCTMATAINSDAPGPFICDLSKDAMSKSGVVLMEKGTRVIGTYSSTQGQGANRILAVAATAYTPNDVVVPLGGPVADTLGAAGVEGNKDNHVVERFLPAVLLTLLDGGMNALQASLSKGGSTYLNLNTGGGGVSSLAQETLRQSINIPPTITLPQGSEIGLWVTVPLEFSDSYRLEMVK